MTVEYRASTVTKMDIEDSKIGYKQFFGDGSRLPYSVIMMKNSPYRVATIILGFLCVLLVLGIIGQAIHYQKLENVYKNNLTTINKDKENLQEKLETQQKENRQLEAKRDELEQSKTSLSKRILQLQTNNNLLTTEASQLKQKQSQLQSSKDALDNEIKTLKESRASLQYNLNASSRAQELLQKHVDEAVKTKKDFQVRYNSAIYERDNLQNKFNNVTRSKQQLQLSYNDLIKRVEHLQDRYNFTSSEKGKLENAHQNLTIAKDTLQSNYNVLVNATDELRGAYASLIHDKNDLEKTCKNVTAERNLLRVKNDNLTTERDQLQVEIDRLHATIEDKRCPNGWSKHEYSCYFTSVEKKTWSKSREHCQSMGADLAIIKTQEEMEFVNGLYSADKEVWIGLTDEGVEGHWRWVDGTLLNKTFWAKGQPNSYDGRNQDCVEFWHRATSRGEWNDENCNVEQNWMCEK
ncbi:C-type lectin domain family 4 member M-like [Channa argus]|uniref:C-type lectin domain family 4 member M-like n=1 Tax=Channa argus TaxID=215402 RepID=UPI002945403C|nr:hypothetical protein Q8A73_003785 [Channa argus]